ncbi:MAG: alanine--glyoxylate aminotransferase family protein [Anaerolineales bacterium]|nr:MAG: alanine--glyoxylate aminotransferase family protein [Anaerolineales bacterium]
MKTDFQDLKPSPRVLLGPGPSNVHPRVLRAMATPLLGYLDPEFLVIMDEIKELLRYVFQTENDLTLPISGTGTAGMEASLYNIIEPGDRVVVVVKGFFGERICDMAERCGAQVKRIEVEWGRIVEPEQVKAALKDGGVKVVALVHAETSTGVLQPLEEISQMVHEHEAFLLVDAVTSLGGHPVKVDDRGIDICYSGSQKCLACPPGLAPITFNNRAAEAMRNRKSKGQSWYLDMTMVEKYWGQERAYHHTAPITMNYALREALLLIFEEGLEARFERHRLNHQALLAGLQAMGLEPFAQAGHRLWTLNTVRVPKSVEDARIRRRLLDEFSIEIGGGLGPVKGQIWRIGLMGYSSSKQNVLLCLGALETVFREEGYQLAAGAGVAAATEVYS